MRSSCDGRGRKIEVGGEKILLGEMKKHRKGKMENGEQEMQRRDVASCSFYYCHYFSAISFSFIILM